MKRYTVVLELDEDGCYVASCPAFPGCFTQGKTYRQTMSRMRSLLKEFLDIRRQEGTALPVEVGTERVSLGRS